MIKKNILSHEVALQIYAYAIMNYEKCKQDKQDFQDIYEQEPGFLPQGQQPPPESVFGLSLPGP